MATKPRTYCVLRHDLDTGFTVTCDAAPAREGGCPLDTDTAALVAARFLVSERTQVWRDVMDVARVPQSGSLAETVLPVGLEGTQKVGVKALPPPTGGFDPP